MKPSTTAKAELDSSWTTLDQSKASLIWYDIKIENELDSVVNKSGSKILHIHH